MRQRQQVIVWPALTEGKIELYWHENTLKSLPIKLWRSENKLHQWKVLFLYQYQNHQKLQEIKIG